MPCVLACTGNLVGRAARCDHCGVIAGTMTFPQTVEISVGSKYPTSIDITSYRNFVCMMYVLLVAYNRAWRLNLTLTYYSYMYIVCV